MIRSVLLAFGFSAGLVAAASGRLRAQDSTRDTTMRAGIQFDGAKLAPIRLTYRATVDSSVWGERTVQVIRTIYEGVPAWLVIETHPGTPSGPFADSLTVDSATLRPLHWSGVSDGARAGAEFRSDSVFGRLSGPPGGHSVGMAIPPGTLASAAMIETAFRALPVAAGWRDSAVVLVNGLGTTRFFPGELEVVGQERLTVPAGTFDCWIVTLTIDPGQATYWVAKREGFVVKTSQLQPDNAGLLMTYTLVRVGDRPNG